MAHTHAPAPSTSVNPAAHQVRLIATHRNRFGLPHRSGVGCLNRLIGPAGGCRSYAHRHVRAGGIHNHRHTDAPQAQITLVLGAGPGLRCSPLPQVPRCCSSLASMRWWRPACVCSAVPKRKSTISACCCSWAFWVLPANIISIFILASQREDNMNMKAAFLEVMNDALGSVAVVASAP